MLELVEPKTTLSKDEYRRAMPRLEIEMGECQRAARAAGVPVLIVFEGWDASGKGTLINALTQALDPRGFKVHPISAPTEEERFRPWMWRFWNRIPPAGNMAIYDRSWYGRVLVERVEKLLDADAVKAAYGEIQAFERQLTDDGAVVVKFWLHIAKGTQKKRFKQLKAVEATAWKVGKAERRQHKRYGKWAAAVEQVMEQTGAPHAPWTIVEATEERFARVKVFETVIRAVRAGLDRRSARAAVAPHPAATPPRRAKRETTILDRVDLSLTLTRAAYERDIDRLQDRLFELEHEIFLARIPVVVVYEGVDAGGKGGSIRRLTQGLDPRGYEVIPVAAPTAEEKAHHYLWRFWRSVPKAGHITVFDRSWYGRVMVERVEGFCTDAEWMRAYREINEFERQLAGYGAVIVKFYVLIDRHEQLRRFRARERTAYKQWKITDEDWRNRAKWRQYEAAAVDMLQQTSTTCAPWTILEANCKLYARIKALRTVAAAMERAIRERSRRR